MLRNSKKFTMETEEDGALPFLDVLVKRDGNKMKTTVYRKPTHTDWYLHFQSHHPQIKSGIVKTLAHRAAMICHEDELQSELAHLQGVFEKNGYPPELVRSCLKKTKKSTAPTTGTPSQTGEEEPIEEEKPKVLSLPYVRGLSE